MAHTLLEPPPVESPPPDPEALIEEARRRARRRRAAYAAAAVLAVAAGLVALFGAGGDGTKARRAPEPGRPATTPPVGKLVDTLPIQSNLFAARGSTLFALELQTSRPDSVVVVRAGKTITRRRIAFPHSEFLMWPTVGRYGLYPGSNVIKRFYDVPDELVRIDLRTLTVRARAFFPSAVQPTAEGAGLWATLGDGRVMRLDPRSLVQRASRRLGGPGLSRPVLGLGSLWVFDRDRSKPELFRLDPMTLAVRSRTRVSASVQTLLGDPRHVYLLGAHSLTPVSADGTVRRTVGLQSTSTLAVQGRTLVALLSRPVLALLTPRGQVIQRTKLRDWSAELAFSGRDIWFDGDAGQGEGIVHFRLR